MNFFWGFNHMKQFTPDERNRLRVGLRAFIDIYATLMNSPAPVANNLVRMAVRYGELIDDPMNESAIAAFTQIPRSTVHRHLKELEEKGQICLTRDGRQVLPKHNRFDPPSYHFYRQILRALDNAERQLSKTGT